MKKIVASLSLSLAIAGVSLAQSVNSAGSVSAANQTDISKNNGSAILSSGTQISGQLQNSIDVKKAKVGDQVILKTTQNIKQNGQVVVKKGSNIVGRVTEVQQKTKGQAASKLGVVFDSLQNGKMIVPISATVVSLTKAQAGINMNDNSADVFGSSSTNTSTSSSTGGGGLLGGVTNTVGSVVNTTTNTVGGVTNTVGNTVGGTLKGIHISQSSDTSVEGSSMLSLQGGNLRLEKGTTFNLRVTESASINK